MKDRFISYSATRFCNALPGWVKSFILYADVDSPGRYSNSYQLDILPLKGDPNRDKVVFEGYTSDMIKEELDIYKKSYQRLYKDYEISELTTY